MMSRNPNLDLLRVVACYMVFQIHAGEFFYIGDGGSVINNANAVAVGVMNSLCRCAVPLFLMISGYLLLPLSDTWEVFFKKRFARVLIPFVIWCCVYAAAGFFKGESSAVQMFFNMLNIPVNYGTQVGHLWYVYMLMGLYLFAPIISPWIAGASKNQMRFFLAIWAVTLLLPYIHQIAPEVWGECHWNDTPMFYYFSGLIGYFVLGAYIKKYPSKNMFASLVLIGAGYLVTLFGFENRLPHSADIPYLELTWGYSTFNVAFLAFGIFTLLNGVKIPQTKLSAVMSDISKKSYGMYLAHILILNFYFSAIKIDNIYLLVPALAAATFVTSYLLVKLLSYLPKSKFIIG